MKSITTKKLTGNKIDDMDMKTLEESKIDTTPIVSVETKVVKKPPPKKPEKSMPPFPKLQSYLVTAIVMSFYSDEHEVRFLLLCLSH